MGRDRSKFSYGIPGGRAYYRGKDAYASQSFENETRAEQAPGYIRAILQDNLAASSSTTHTVPWTTAPTESKFIKPMTLSGWGYSASTYQFVCQRGGRYQIAYCAGISGTTADTDDMALMVKVTRSIQNINYDYFIIAYATAGGSSTHLSLHADFDFQVGDLVKVLFDNPSSNNLTVLGTAGAGTSEEDSHTWFNMWQVDT